MTFKPIVIAALTLFAGQAWAQRTLFADCEITTTCNTYDPASRGCGKGTNTAYPNLATAAAAAAPGTTVLIRGGSYNEQLAPHKSGTSNNYITFRNYNSELVYLAFAGTREVAIDISGCSRLIIDGLHVEDKNTYWLEADDARFNVIQNCVFKHSPTTGTRGNLQFVRSDFNLLLNNDIEDGQDDVALIESDHNLVQGNTIMQARHSIFGIRCGNYNIIRSNYFSNTEQKIGEVYDCGDDTHAVSNLFNATKHNVIEDNIFALTYGWHTVAGGNGIQYAGQQGIIRRNVFYDCNVGLGMQVYGDESRHNIGNRVYNNDFYTNVGAGIATWPGAANNIYLNNILFGNRGCVHDCAITTPGQIVYRASMVGEDLFMNNDLFFQHPGDPVVEEEYEDGYSIAQFTGSNRGILLNSREFDPQFVDATNHDFHLKPTSPMIDAGAFLTATRDEGSGKNVPVIDATYFQDGFGIPGAVGDSIQFLGQTKTAVIVHVDYDSNTLTLDRPLKWRKGQALSLPLMGHKPDIGAFEAGEKN